MTNIKLENIKINGEYEVVQGIKVGKVTGKEYYFHYIAKNGQFWTGIKEAQNEVEHEELINESISELLADELEGEEDVEGQFLVDGDVYRVWVAVSVEGNKVNYSLSTVHQDLDEERNMDANSATRKTYKGLVNYIARFI